MKPYTDKLVLIIKMLSKYGLSNIIEQSKKAIKYDDYEVL